MKAVYETATETQQRVNRILAAMDDTQKLMRKELPKIYSKDLVEVIFEHPYSKVNFLVERGIAKRQTASTYLKNLADIGLLAPIKKGLEVYYVNKALFDILPG